MGHCHEKLCSSVVSKAATLKPRNYWMLSQAKPIMSASQNRQNQSPANQEVV